MALLEPFTVGDQGHRYGDFNCLILRYTHRAANTQQPWRDHEQALGGRARDNEDTDVCYVCQEPRTTANILIGARRCSLKAHQSCHWAWMNASTNSENEIIIYTRDKCSACKTLLNIAAIDAATATNLWTAVPGT